MLVWLAELVEALRYKPEGLGFDSRWCHWIFSLTQSFRPHCGPGVYPASSGNWYQECFLEVKTAGAYVWQPYQLHAPIVLKSEVLKLPETSGSLNDCNWIAVPLRLRFTLDLEHYKFYLYFYYNMLYWNCILYSDILYYNVIYCTCTRWFQIWPGMICV
jgi:hypothetical protein